MADKDNTAQDPDSIELVKEGPGPAPEENKIILAREVLPRQLPIIPVNQRPLFPKMTVPMVIDDEPLVSMLIELVKSQPRLVGIVLRRDAGSGGGEGDGQPDKPTALHPVGVVADVCHLAQAPAPLEPIHRRQHHVQDDRVRVLLIRGTQSRSDVTCGDHLEFLCTECELEEIAYLGVVLDDKNPEIVWHSMQLRAQFGAAVVLLLRRPVGTFMICLMKR